MDEQEKIERRAHVRLIVTEVLMFLSVIALVGFLTLVVMGYSFNLREIGGEGEVIERSGLVQVSSLPTGATIFVDGEAPLLFSTNASRTLIAEEHEIGLSKDGFLGWKKTVKVTEGMIYRLNYPRLFKEEREKEEVLTLSAAPKLVSVSPNNERMLVEQAGALYIIYLNEGKPEMKAVGTVGTDGNVVIFTTLQGAEWSGNSEKVLLKVNGEWAVIGVRDKSLVSLAGVGAKEVKFESEAGDRLLVLNEKKELREFNVRDGKLSEVLVSGVEQFDNDGDRVVFLSEDGSLRAYRAGERETYEVMAEVSGAVKFATMRYFQESYVAVVKGGEFKVYRKTGWPTADGEMEKVFEEEVGFKVTSVKKRGKGMVFELLGSSEEGEARNEVFDMEAMALTAVDVKDSGWVDEYLRYRLVSGKLSVFDYDGLNERVLVESGVLSGRVVAISGNNRWLYYFSSTIDEEGATHEKLVREKIN